MTAVSSETTIGRASMIRHRDRHGFLTDAKVAGAFRLTGRNHVTDCFLSEANTKHGLEPANCVGIVNAVEIDIAPIPEWIDERAKIGCDFSCGDHAP